MAIYSIRDLEKLTGIKAHTIRIWEQRYGLVVPARTDTNIRYYTDENLRLLFNVALLNRNGYKISKLAKMTPEEIAERVADISENSGSQNTQIDALTLAMIDLDEATFDRIFPLMPGNTDLNARWSSWSTLSSTNSMYYG
ncbi:MAG: MerR family transcriptional regulator [Lewinellaceae bacterium]|nr:MerR family transcriptional regulator [Lewinellaceae bacterium]